MYDVSCSSRAAFSHSMMMMMLLSGLIKRLYEEIVVVDRMYFSPSILWSMTSDRVGYGMIKFQTLSRSIHLTSASLSLLVISTVSKLTVFAQ